MCARVMVGWLDRCASRSNPYSHTRSLNVTTTFPVIHGPIVSSCLTYTNIRYTKRWILASPGGRAGDGSLAPPFVPSGWTHAKVTKRGGGGSVVDPSIDVKQVGGGRKIKRGQKGPPCHPSYDHPPTPCHATPTNQPTNKPTNKKKTHIHIKTTNTHRSTIGTKMTLGVTPPRPNLSSKAHTWLSSCEARSLMAASFGTCSTISPSRGKWRSGVSE
jgi:hypothetical protein